jgi:hypothetical protein
MDPYFLLREMNYLLLNQLYYLRVFFSIQKISRLIDDHVHDHHKEYSSLKQDVVLNNYVEQVLQDPINDIFDILFDNFVLIRRILFEEKKDQKYFQLD